MRTNAQIILPFGPKPLFFSVSNSQRLKGPWNWLLAPRPLQPQPLEEIVDVDASLRPWCKLKPAPSSRLCPPFWPWAFQKPKSQIVPPVNIRFNPTTKIGSLKWVVNSPIPTQNGINHNGFENHHWSQGSIQIPAKMQARGPQGKPSSRQAA